MNQDLPTPDDADLDNRLSNVQRRLRHAQPRAAQVDADKILAAACEQEKRTRHNPARPFATITASWVCGAAAGVLITLAVLRPERVDEFGAHTSGGSHSPPRSELKHDEMVQTELATATDGSGISRADWSSGERLVTVQLARFLDHSHADDSRALPLGVADEPLDVPIDRRRTINRNDLLKEMTGSSPVVRF